MNNTRAGEKKVWKKKKKIFVARINTNGTPEATQQPGFFRNEKVVTRGGMSAQVNREGAQKLKTAGNSKRKSKFLFQGGPGERRKQTQRR